MRHLKIVFLAWICLFTWECNKNSTDEGMMDAKLEADLLSEYFSAATTGFISSHDDLRYILAKSPDRKLSDEDLQKVITLSPATSGLVSLSDGNVLSFVPAEAFTANTAYRVSLKLSMLHDGWKDISYTIHTFRQDILVEEQGFIIGDNGRIALQAMVSTADKATEEDVRKCFTSNAANVGVSSLDPRKFLVSFEFPESSVGNAQIDYDASSIGGETKGSYLVPAINTAVFEPLLTKHDAQAREFKVYFSQRLSSTVDLTGLVLVGGVNARYSQADNVLTVYLGEYTTDQEVVIDLKKGIAGKSGKTLTSDQQFYISIEVEKPEISFLDEGIYFPSEGDFKIPVKARGLESVNVLVLEINAQNVNSFLTWQSLQYTDYYSMRMYAKPVFNKKVKLDKGIKDADGWRTYGIDLGDKLRKNPGSIYHIAFDFTPEDINLSCKEELLGRDLQSKLPGDDYFYAWETYYRDYYMNDFNWEDRDNPCTPSFYADKFPVSRTFICSNFGVIAKQSGQGYFFAVNKLMDLSAVSGANVSLYDLQGDLITSAQTDANGFAETSATKSEAGIAKIEKAGEITYVRLNPAESNTLTEFAVQGTRTAQDAEMFLYTERDVWRPGDSIYLDVMLNKSNLSLPDGLPLICSFYNPDQMLLSRKVVNLKTSDKLIYSFVEATPANAKTGAYRFVIEAGPRKYAKRIRIETIKPNTTEVVYSYKGKDGDFVLADKLSGTATVKFLTGFEVAGATVQLTGRPSGMSTPFPKFRDFHFGMYQKPEVSSFRMAEFTTNAQGQATFSSNASLKMFNSPVVLSLETESTLKDGGSNKQGNSVKVSPFTSYVGVQKVDGQGWSGNHVVGETVKFNLTSIDQKGNLSSSGKKVSIKIEKRLQSWWIDKYMLRSNGFYYDASSWQQIKTDAVNISGGKTSYDLAANQLGEGTYHVIFTDETSGQKSDSYFTVYKSGENIPGSQPYIVQFDVSAEEVEAGQEVRLRFPSISGARALISIEKANTIVEKRWVELDKNNGEVVLKTTPDWSPNVYIHATVVQPYMQDMNDLPLRMYGIKPLQVNSNSRELQPVASLSDKLESNQTYQFTVSEAQGKSMEYTFALVDEGLLNLTGFNSPDPYKHFNGDFPLLVKTWDIYQWLMRYFKGKFAGILAIGGDDAYHPDALAEISRFKPVVIHQGSFKLSAGGKNKHSVSIPNYVGKLRLMIVAANQTDFGKLSKTVSVINPLMVQSQLPRSLNVTDKLRLPVNIMRDDKGISKVSLETKASNQMIKGLAPSVSLNFDGKDQVTQVFQAEVLNQPGKLGLDFTVKGGGKEMTEHSDMLIQYPNSYESEEVTSVIQPGQSQTFTITAKGYKEAFKSSFVISGQKMPAFTQYADELMEYPYGCLEQTTSGALAQLHLDKLIEMEPEQNQKRLANLEAALTKLQRFQHSDGRFYYWDNQYYHAWSDIYAGDFLMEYVAVGNAERISSMVQAWVKAQTNAANTWSAESLSSNWTYEYESAVQAYRLYVLAKGGKPAKSAMNRFVASNHSQQALVWWLMAGAHKFASYDSKASEFVDKAETMQTQTESYNTFGSNARNLAIAVEVLAQMPELKKKADQYYDAMVDAYNKSNWLSTQDKGAAFKASLAYYGDQISKAAKITYSVNGPSGNKSFEHSSFESRRISQSASDFGKTYTVSNKGKTPIYVKQNSRYISSGITGGAMAENLNLSVLYNGSSTPPSAGLGEDIVISVTVSNALSLEQNDLALNVKMPAGWELLNPRIYATESGNTAPGATYQDYRDDRVYTFFSLSAGANKTFSFKAKAAFAGDFLLPAVSVENMYKGDYRARTNISRAVVKM